MHLLRLSYNSTFFSISSATERELKRRNDLEVSKYLVNSLPQLLYWSELNS